MSYVELGDVRTWFDVRGEGEPLVLLHPGGADARSFAPVLPELEKHFRVYTPERRGHGRTPDAAGPITFELMAADTVRFIEGQVGEPTRVLGYSDGATVGLFTALRAPQLVRQLVVVAGVFHHRGWLPGILELDEETSALLARGYGELSPDGVDHYAAVARKLAVMHAGEPELTADDLAAVHCRTLVMTGDDDEVALEHTLELYRSLRDGELAVVPGTSHGLLHERPDLCNAIVLDFLLHEPVETFAPIRRKRETADVGGSA